MFERSWSDGSPGALGERERLVQQAERRLHAVQLVAADAERVEDLCALEIGEAARPRRARAPRSEARAPARSAPRRICVRPAPTRARTASSGTPVARAAGTSDSYSAAASSFCSASISASARASAPSSRPRSSVATPFARKPGSTPSRAASHSTVSRVGRVLPRSIWETYSFEKRSPARSLCVRPAATRSWRRRSPRRSPLGARGGAARGEGGVSGSCAA